MFAASYFCDSGFAPSYFARPTGAFYLLEVGRTDGRLVVEPAGGSLSVAAQGTALEVLESDGVLRVANVNEGSSDA